MGLSLFPELHWDLVVVVVERLGQIPGDISSPSPSHLLSADFLVQEQNVCAQQLWSQMDWVCKQVSPLTL